MTDQEAIFEPTKIIEIPVFMFHCLRSDALLAIFLRKIPLSLLRKDGLQSLTMFVIGGRQ
jgi:hypothetical protein